MARRVLITGASVAGNAAAWWLTHYGFDVTVVEKAPSFRDGGQNIDVRGAGRVVLRKMGLEAAALERGTGEQGTAFVDEEGRVLTQFEVADDGDGPTAEMEILRGDLARLLYEPTSQRATFRFGDSIRSIDDASPFTRVTFDGGTTEDYEIVIVAEGVGSSTRERVFPGENHPRWMDCVTAYFTIPKTETDTKLARWYNATGRRSIYLRPDQEGTTRASLIIQHSPEGAECWTEDQQKAYMREQFHDAGWEAKRVLAGMETTDDFYFDVLRQVRLERWSSGRVVLTGDAAWAPTPLAGIGATLALVGAYVLAGELSKSNDVDEALSAYERIIRPFVEKGQDVPKLIPKLLNPETHFGLMVLRGVQRMMNLPGIHDVAARALPQNTAEIDLPDYS